MIWFKWHFNTSSMLFSCCSLVQLLFLGFKNMSSTRSPHSPQILQSACQAFIKHWLVFAFNIHSGCTSHYIKQWIMASCPFFVLPHFHRFQLNLKKEFLGIAWQSPSSPRSGILTRETVQLNCSDGPDYDTSPSPWLLALTMYIAVIQPNVRQSHLWSRNLSPLCHCEELRKLSDVIIRLRLQGKVLKKGGKNKAPPPPPLKCTFSYHFYFKNTHKRA